MARLTSGGSKSGRSLLNESLDSASGGLHGHATLRLLSRSTVKLRLAVAMTSEFTVRHTCPANKYFNHDLCWTRTDWNGFLTSEQDSSSWQLLIIFVDILAMLTKLSFVEAETDSSCEEGHYLDDVCTRQLEIHGKRHLHKASAQASARILRSVVACSGNTRPRCYYVQ